MRGPPTWNEWLLLTVLRFYVTLTPWELLKFSKLERAESTEFPVINLRNTGNC